MMVKQPIAQRRRVPGKPGLPPMRLGLTLVVRLRKVRQSEAGYTLMEVLVVISILLLLTLIVIPNLPGRKIETNEVSAIQALRGIYAAEVQYETTYPSRGFACSLAALGGDPRSGAPSPEQAKVLPSDLASGQKSGYRFRVEKCIKAEGVHQDLYTSFEVTAIPRTVGTTGHRGFCIDQQGEVRADPAGGANCTQNLQ